ncbi:MAG: YiiX/YebB-like N1pC/P60 family cysteine hydrolase [Bacteriovoracaceae bacterium]|jgi:uncharacterized protein YycO|nr:YiiX/YebB-like N1pC/P60 family cysteine hydrolase [Bacteriovoracaceae bacterium]
MKVHAIFLISMILNFSCSQFSSLKRKIASNPMHEIVQSEQEFQNYFSTSQEIIEENMVWRAKALEFYNEIRNNEVLSNKDIITLHQQGTEKYIEMRQNLWEIILQSEWLTQPKTQIAISFEQPTSITQKTIRRVNPGRTSSMSRNEFISFYSVHINPADKNGQQIIKQIKLSLASALVLYDNYTIVLSQFHNIKKLRRLINSDHEDLDNYLNKVTLNALDIENFTKISKALDFYRKIQAIETQNKFNLDNQDSYLNALIQGSLSYTQLNQKLASIDLITNHVSFFSDFFGDTLKLTSDEMSHQVSKVFGNTVGLVQTRNGKLYKMSEAEKRNIHKKLKPLDILLEKTPFRLTDKFIPGHWGHVAIWSGTKKELIELELWDHPLIKPFQKEIEFEGKRIIEALRPGVQINTLEHFLNIDDIAVIRHKHLSKQEKQKYLIQAFDQIGKEYDFNFDVETDEKIVCSELAYVVYNDMEWPTDKQLGRYTISPDHVALKVGKTKDFTGVLLYHDGKRVKNNINKNLNFLLEGKYSQIQFD